MSSTMPGSDPLAQIHELNRLFLESLQGRDAGELRAGGFPPGAVAALKSATAAQLGALAEFPRALFNLVLADPDRRKALVDVVYHPRQVLELTIVFSVWSISRDSVYHARLFFGLSPSVVHRLRTTPLSDLPRLALTGARVDCAFPDCEGLWRELLVETRPEARRQLILVALQPSLERAAVLDQVAEHERQASESS